LCEIGEKELIETRWKSLADQVVGATSLMHERVTDSKVWRSWYISFNLAIGINTLEKTLLLVTSPNLTPALFGLT